MGVGGEQHGARRDPDRHGAQRRRGRVTGGVGNALALARAAQIGAERVAVASTGNAGSSLAGLAASMGIPAAIFVPATAPRAKLIQALMYGAQVFAARGSYDDAFELCLEACRHLNWYKRKTA